jgi:calmodulin
MHREVVTYERKLDIPEDQIAEYKEAFDMFDKDHKGTIGAVEISKIMKNFGNPMTKDEIDDMIKEFDTSGDGQLDFDEFVSLLQKQTRMIEESEEDAVLRAFQAFDSNMDGKISNMEFKYFLTKIGDKFSDEEINYLWNYCKLKDDEDLPYHDFIKSWRNIKKILPKV